MSCQVIQHPAMHIYHCRACERDWKQELFFDVRELCVYCGSMNTFLVGMETTEVVARRPDPEPGILWWSKDADLDAWPKMKTMPRWLFAVLHPVLYWRMFLRKEGIP